MIERKLGADESGPTDGPRVDWSRIPRERPYEGVQRQRYDSALITIIRYGLAPGARHPAHKHDDEQIVHVQAGRVRFSVGDEAVVLGPGDLLHVGPAIPHAASAEGGPTVFLTISPRRA